MISNEMRQYLTKVGAILNAHEVDYIVVGGAAVSHYGHNRPSGIGYINETIKVDLDFWYNPTVENYYKILEALKDLQTDTSELQDIVFDKKKTFLKIPHKSFHTDFLPVMEGLDAFRISKQRAVRIDIEGVSLHILSFDDLVANKKAVNRKVDQSDIIELTRIQKKKRRGRGI